MTKLKLDAVGKQLLFTSNSLGTVSILFQDTSSNYVITVPLVTGTMLVDGLALGTNSQQSTTLAAFVRQSDALVMPLAKQILLNTPPGSPADGDVYVIGAAPTGLWSANAKYVTRWSTVSGIWEFYLPKTGWIISDQTTNQTYTYNGSTWVVWGVSDSLVVHIAGTETITGAKTFSAITTFSNATAASSASTGAVVISTGGLGVGGKIWGGGNANFDGGSVAIGTNAGTTGAIALNTAAGNARGFQIQTAGNLRWNLQATATAEGGSDAGSNFALTAYTDAGASIDSPINITRASAGGMTLGGSTNRPLTSNGNLTVGTSAGTTGIVALNAATGNNRGFQFLTAGTLRWFAFATNATESGSDAGTGWSLNAYTDGGSTIDTPINIIRASGGAMTLGGATSRNITIGTTANGAAWTFGVISEQITLSTGGTTTDSAANLLPANAIIESVVARITTTITVATNWSLGDATIAARFAAANSTLTAGTTSIGLQHVDQTGTSGPKQTAAAKLRITTTGTPGAGVIRVTVYYRTFTAPTS